MSETEGNPARPPRFPYAAALLCAACLVAAVWTWMRYSYVWDVTVDYLSENIPRAREGRRPGRLFVRFPGIVAYREHGVSVRSSIGGWEFEALARGDSTAWVTVRVDAEAPPSAGGEMVFSGRVYAYEAWTPLPDSTDYVAPPSPPKIVPYVNAAASRFAGASVAGLVVGAMGVFVFTVAFLHWLRERRECREVAAGS